ncbi:hypothetical protein SDC9_197222 [bioreactor metagenome]|uniref:Uncharacterized protein n=1 Tax=bioreactor metagenome TaxID=1076179 RepID=A0A645IEQ7_9ZZZZ
MPDGAYVEADIGVIRFRRAFGDFKGSFYYLFHAVTGRLELFFVGAEGIGDDGAGPGL